MKSMKLVVVLVVMCLMTAQVLAASAVYYRMENTVTSTVNSPTVDLTLGSGAGYSTDVPGSIIVDGASQYANTASYDNGTAPGSLGTDYSVARAAIDGDGSDGSGFTIEYFVKIDVGATAAQTLKWDGVVTNDSWYMNLNANQLPTFGATTAAYPDPTVEANWGEINSNAGTLTEGVWHHVAAVGTVYDGHNAHNEPWALYEIVTLYVDYQPVGTKQYYAQGGMTPQHPRFAWSSKDIKIASGNPFNGGLLDEIRISNTPLAPADMLHAIPEPATIALLGFGVLGLLRKKR